MDIAKEVDVVCICNVVDDERPRYELFIVRVVTVITVCILVVSVSLVIVGFFAMVTALIVVCIARFSAMSLGIVLDVCIVLISAAVVLSQKRCSSEEEQGGKQGLE